MEKFKWAQARSINEAQTQVTHTISDLTSGSSTGETTVIKAGGVDLLDLMKEGIASPGKVIDIKVIPNFDKLTFEKNKGLRIGAGVTLSEIKKFEPVQKRYTALYEALSHAATPQVRNMATLGGNLAQRPRCWYFRSVNHLCKKKGGDVCYAQIGQNDIHAIYNTTICPCVHSSSIATALMAFQAEVEYADQNGKIKTVPIADFFILPEEDVTRENILKPKEIITAVILPDLPANTKSFYIKQGARESYDWALADVATVLEMSGNTCTKANVVLGAAAPKPLKASSCEKVLQGSIINEETASIAAEEELKNAKPLSGNQYKVPMFKAIIKNCILKTIA